MPRTLVLWIVSAMALCCSAFAFADGPEPGGLGAEKRVRYGPADPTYSLPVVPAGSPELTAELVGPFRYRAWPVRLACFANGAVVHMPRWFADPYDDVTMYEGCCFGWSCDDLLASFYSPLRWAVNALALPVSVIVHPVWSPEITDHTATIVNTDCGVQVEECTVVRGR